MNSTMDEDLEIKRIDREIVVLIVAKELNELAREAAIGALESMGTDKKFTTPDIKKWANRIISIIKEHSV